MPGCKPDPVSGFANVDMDSIPNQDVSVVFTEKAEHTDADRVVHPATVGTFTYEVSYCFFVTLRSTGTVQ